MTITRVTTLLPSIVLMAGCMRVEPPTHPDNVPKEAVLVGEGKVGAGGNGARSS
jgi:hypothetical protein